MRELRTTAIAASAALLLTPFVSRTPERPRPCVAGTRVPTPESDLPVVEHDPGVTEPTSRLGLSYPHRQGELLVFPRRRGPALAAEIPVWSTLWQEVGATLLRFDASVPLYEIRLPPQATLEAVGDRLLQSAPELIESVYANSCIFPQQGTTDPNSPDQWGHWQIRLEDAWKITSGAPSVVVAVIDSGIDHQNPDLACNFWVNPCEPENGRDDDTCKGKPDGRVDDVHGWNFVDDTNVLFDHASHGTMIAGIIGACHNQTFVVGVDWSVSIMDLRVYDTVGDAGSLGYVLSAIPYAAANGATAINASWTTVGAPKLKAAIQAASDVVFVTAAADAKGAGNEIKSSYQVFPCSWTPDLPNLICVTSSTRADKKADTANYGAVVQIAAPGEEILSTDGTSVGTRSGTSFAVPYAVGVAALVKAHFPTASANEIVRRVVCGAELSTLAGVTRPGRNAGTGRRLDAMMALECEPPPTSSPGSH